MLRLSFGAIASALLVLASFPAAADDTKTDALPQAAPIVDGHPVPPRPAPLPKSPTDREASEMLQSAPDPGPPVQPHDIYGNPLGAKPAQDPPPSASSKL